MIKLSTDAWVNKDVCQVVYVMEDLVLTKADLEEFKKGLGDQWVNLYVEGYSEITSFRFARETRSVLDVLILNITYENKIGITREDIALKLGIHTTKVSRAFKALREKWIIYPIICREDRRRVNYYFNPRYYWVGAEADRMALMNVLDKTNLVKAVRAAREQGLEAI